MQHFVSKLQFSIQIANKELSSQYEELTVLIEAANKLEAYDKATNIGNANEDEFRNANENTVFWKFEGITHLFQLPTLENGSVLFSELKDDYSPEQLLVVQQRIRKVKENFINDFLYSDFPVPKPVPFTSASLSAGAQGTTVLPKSQPTPRKG